MVRTTEYSDLPQPGGMQSTAKSRIGLIVATSIAVGLVLAMVLVALPFIPATENVLTGVVLLAWALGWASLAVLSVRFRPAAKVGGSPGHIHGGDRPRLTQRVRCRARCSQLGLAASPACARCLDDH